MKLHRFFGNYDFTTPVVRALDAELTHQLKNVLRVRCGEVVELADGKCNEALAQIEAYEGEDNVIFQILKVEKNLKEPLVGGVMYCAILKQDNFEWVVEKATEAGIKEIVPVVSHRTVKFEVRKDRLEKIVREAAEQSGRGVLPVIHDTLDFQQAVADAVKRHKMTLFFDESGEPFKGERLEGQVAMFIGPEGGWDEEEVSTALDQRLRIVSLGVRTLRAETAAVVATYLVANVW